MYGFLLLVPMKQKSAQQARQASNLFIYSTLSKLAAKS